METTGDFVRLASTVPPFDLLDADILSRLAGQVREACYRQGTVILTQDGPASENLVMLKSGSVKVFVHSADSGEVVIDHRAAGEVFGFLSLVVGDRSRANVVATEDSHVYLIPRLAVVALLETNPRFSRYLVESLLAKYVDRTFGEMRVQGMLFGSGDRLLFSTPLGELAKEVTTAPAETTVREAALAMTRDGSSSLLVVSEDGSPVGMVTDRDLRAKVLAGGLGDRTPIGSLMTTGLVTASSRELCFEGLLKMLRHNIHHLPVIEEGKLSGMVTNHDLMILQGTSPLSLVREMERLDTVEGLAVASRRVQDTVTLLLKEGARPGAITRVVTEINDRLVSRVIRLSERELGPPPLPYCWLAFGSEGRKEQTFRTDQDNAIVYADVTSGHEEDARAYFARLASSVNDGLIRCGFPPCPGGYMASNELWRRPLAAWRRTFDGWMATPTPEAVLASLIVFDFRAVHGDESLAASLRDHLCRETPRHAIFLKYLAGIACKVRPPLGFLRRIVVERSGEHAGRFNVKFKCLAPVLNVVRLFALEQGIPETATLERIDALRRRHSVVAEHGDELVQAFEFFLHLRMRHQQGFVVEGRTPDDWIAPAELGALDLRTFKESCQIVGRIQDAIAWRYSPGTSI